MVEEIEDVKKVLPTFNVTIELSTIGIEVLQSVLRKLKEINNIKESDTEVVEKLVNELLKNYLRQNVEM